MDWITSKSLADVATVVLAIVQLICLPLVLYQVMELRNSLHSTAHSSIYTRYADTIRWLLDKPHLYPYFRENARLEKSGPAPDAATKKAEVNLLCELTTTLFEHAMLERENMPPTSWQECWLPYIKASYEQSVEMRLFFEKHHNFYVPEYRKLIADELRPKWPSTESTLDRPVAKGS
jgi:hypothetical protein